MDTLDLLPINLYKSKLFTFFEPQILELFLYILNKKY